MYFMSSNPYLTLLRAQLLSILVHTVLYYINSTVLTLLWSTASIWKSMRKVSLLKWNFQHKAGLHWARVY